MARILVAEDEEVLRDLIVRGLAQDGHEVLSAQDGAEALDMLCRASEPFDLLLADIRMPLMDGIALALTAARDRPGLVILLMTTYTDQRARASSLDRLIQGVISKPFTLETLRAAVATALRAAARGQAGHRPGR